MSTLSQQEYQNELLKIIDFNISIVVENKVEPSSDKCCLKHLPVFTLKDINVHRLSSGRDKNAAISKTLVYRFNTSKYTKNTFTIKAKCSASMKKIKRDVAVTLTRKTSIVEKAKCSFPADTSSYCNHTMALLFEFADYSLKDLTEVPQEVYCTSQAKKWGIAGESDSFKEPIMSKVVCKGINKKGVNPTLYEPINKFDNIEFSCKLETLETSLRKQDTQIAFSHCITSVQERKLTDSMFRNLYFGSPLSYYLEAVDFSYKVLSNIKNGHMISFGWKSKICFKLPMHFLPPQSQLIPNWQPYTEEENTFFQDLFVTKDEVVSIEKRTAKQATCNKWKSLRESRITSSNAHEIFIRKKNMAAVMNELPGVNIMNYSIQNETKYFS